MLMHYKLNKNKAAVTCACSFDFGGSLKAADTSWGGGGGGAK